MYGSRWQRSLAVVVMVAVATVRPSMPIMAKAASKADDTYYKATVPTKNLDPAALEVVHHFSNWPGGYQSAHNALLRLGWQPDPKVDCLSGQTLGEDPKKKCHDDPGDEDCKMCHDMPEISACSQGPVEYCRANLIHPGSDVVLVITTAGDMQGAPETNTSLEQFTFIEKSDPDR